MKRSFFRLHRTAGALLILCVLTLLSGCASDDEAAPAAEPDAAALTEKSPLVSGEASLDSSQALPDLALPQLGGDSLRLQEYKGEVLLVNFWATWCAPCIAEIPDLASLHKTLHPQGLTIVGISMDQGGLETVRPFAQEHNIPYPLVAGGEEAASAFGGVYSLPTTFVINQKGQVARRIIGRFPTEAMRPLLRRMLGLPTQASRLPGSTRPSRSST